MRDELVITYHDTVITYDELRDKWTFTLRGKDRSAQSLTHARNAIDAPPPKDDTPFRRFEAWRNSYGNIQKVTVTSMTETGRFWITGLDSRGRKERAQAGNYELYACDAQNDAVIERLQAKKAELDKFHKELEAIQKELRNVEPKDWEEK